MHITSFMKQRSPFTSHFSLTFNLCFSYTMPTHVFNTDLDSFSEEQIEKLGASRAAILEPAFDEYLMSDNLHDTPLAPSSIQLLPASDLSVKLTRASKSDTAMEVSISKISDPDADNFMGFSSEDNCIVFKGEMGLFDSFLEFAESITQDKDVTVVFKTANQIRIPRQGLEYGLSYEDFAARVELLECAMWIRASRPGQGELPYRLIISVAHSSQDTTQNSMSRQTTFIPARPLRTIHLEEQSLQAPGRPTWTICAAEAGVPAATHHCLLHPRLSPLRHHSDA